MQRLIVSAANPEQHVVVAKLDAGTRVRLRAGDNTTDITGWLADLVLIGMVAALNRASGVEADAEEQVQVATVDLTGEPPVLLYVHPPTGSAVEYDWATAVPIISLGIREQLTAGVAADTAGRDGIPDDPADLAGNPVAPEADPDEPAAA